MIFQNPLSIGVYEMYNEIKNELLSKKKIWLITGVAGFIGSNLLESLLKLNQKVVGLDNFSTGYKRNIEDALNRVSGEQASNFKFIQGDIRDVETCRNICNNVDIVLHQAALGSVPRSIADPITTNQSNIDGFLNMLTAARDAKVKRFVYAASSSTYGDHTDLPKIEERIGKPLSPYAITKYVNELYAEVFGRVYDFHPIGLRYFNVFGPRQDPNGSYAAVIPKWLASFINNDPIYINGDGETSRDFCYIDNVVQANILAGCIISSQAVGQVYNIACGQRTTLNELFQLIRNELENAGRYSTSLRILKEFRKGDVRHSLANIEKAAKFLRYKPTHFVRDGIAETTRWYINNCS